MSSTGRSNADADTLPCMEGEMRIEMIRVDDTRLQIVVLAGVEVALVELATLYTG